MENRKSDKLIEKWYETRTVGFFGLALLFGLFLNIGAMIIYDWFIKKDFMLQVLGLILSLAMLLLVLYAIDAAYKRSLGIEKELKKEGVIDF